MTKHDILKQYFGHDAFRPGQEELIDGILGGRDVLGIMPTGGGKSMCYQIPAMLTEGITLVISPLISLMKDQVMALKNVGVGAAYINSTLTFEQLKTVYRRIGEGAYKIIYAAPERLTADGFLSVMRGAKISLLAVDEAHCISQWGQDFRPSYLKITEFLALLPSRPVVAAYTATATESVRQDIVRILGLRDPYTVVTGFDRPNLSFSVEKPKNKTGRLLDFIRARGDKSGIVYCATRGAVDKVYEKLREEGIPSARYHAGMEDSERAAEQDDFGYDRKTVMVATNAFGMGIDKSNIGWVVHYNMPKSVEAYYQEAGRAGRDGSRAECVLFFSPGDVTTARFLIENGSENEELTPEERAMVTAADMARLDAMVGYCKTTDCLRGYILDYFGQPHEEKCGNCSNCTDEFADVDITTEAQMILSCVKRVRNHLGYFVGVSLIVGVLRGANTGRIRELGLNEVSTYGLMSTTKADGVRDIIDFLIREGYLGINEEYQTLIHGPRAAEVLFHGAFVTMPVRIVSYEEPGEKTKKKEKVPQAFTSDVPEELMKRLKTERRRFAEEEGVPLYVIFSNAALEDMARRRPRTKAEFLDVSGVGSVKAEKYGKAFLQAISEWEEKSAEPL
ncbi:MAG: DNA helicase RecQ [Ruminococcaceae bacterium]|nr:DNA helicase RecQ [Oscillospiraceae bacterium]